MSMMWGVVTSELSCANQWLESLPCIDWFHGHLPVARKKASAEVSTFARSCAKLYGSIQEPRFGSLIPFLEEE